MVSAAQEGDDSAFEALLGPTIEPAYRLACGMLHDRHAAEDAIQEASVKAWRNIRRLRPGSDIRPWFLGIVANECRTTRRAHWWSVLRIAESDQPFRGSLDEGAVGMDVRRAIRRLSYRRRLVLVMHWYLDMSVSEVATATGSTEHAVESELSRGLAQLRRLIGREVD